MLAFAAALLALMLVLAPAARAGFAAAQLLRDATPNTFNEPRAAVDPNGNAIAVWDEFTPSPSNMGSIKARHVSAAGDLGPLLDLSDPADHSLAPAVGVAPNGRAFVSWRASAGSGNPQAVKGRWVDPGGALGSIVTVVSDPTIDAVNLETVVGQDGVASVIWRDQSGGSTIQGRRVGQDDGLSALNANITSGITPRLAPLPNGNTLATWRDIGAEARVWFADNTLGPELTLNTEGLAADPTPGADLQGNALVTWRRHKTTAPEGFSILGRRLDPTGAIVGPELEIDPLAPGGASINITPAPDSLNDFLVTWLRSDGMKSALFARRVNSNGDFAGPAQTISTPGIGADLPVPALFDRGPGAIAWYESPSLTSTVSMGTAVDLAGAPLGGRVPLVAGGWDVAGGGHPSAGIAAFTSAVSNNPGHLYLNRFLLEPICSDTQATVVQGKPTEAPISCQGPAVESAEVVGPPAHGTTGAFNGSTRTFAYTPTPGFDGTDSFTYRASNDGGSSNVSQVQIKVGKDTVRPVISSFRFRERTARGAQVAAKKKRRRAARRKIYSFLLRYSEPSSARVTVERRVRGVRKGKRCRRKTQRLRGRRCTLYRSVGVVSSKQTASSSTIRVPAKLVKRLAGRGRLRATGVATDAAGNKSKVKRRNIRVKKARR